MKKSLEISSIEKQRAYFGGVGGIDLIQIVLGEEYSTRIEEK